jgi:hypothetical protein
MATKPSPFKTRSPGQGRGPLMVGKRVPKGGRAAATRMLARSGGRTPFRGR